MLSASKKHILCNPQGWKRLTQLKTARANSGWKGGWMIIRIGLRTRPPNTTITSAGGPRNHDPRAQWLHLWGVVCSQCLTRRKDRCSPSVGTAMLWRPYCMKGVASEAAQGPSTLVADSTVQPSSSPGQDRRTAGAMANVGGGKGQSQERACLRGASEGLDCDVSGHPTETIARDLGVDGDAQEGSEGSGRYPSAGFLPPYPQIGCWQSSHSFRLQPIPLE